MNTQQTSTDNSNDDALRTSDGRPRRFRRATAIGLTAGLLGGGAAGLLFAAPSLTSAASGTVALQETSTDDSGTVTVTDEAAVATPDRGARVREALQSLVDDGTITAEQADAVATHLADNLPRGGRGGGGGMHGGRGFDGTVVADALGITADELRTALQDGQSIADVAAAEGVDVQVVVDAMVAAAQTRVDEAVAAGRITQEEADTKLAELETRIAERVNTAGPLRGDGMGRGHRGGDAGADADTATDTATDA